MRVGGTGLTPHRVWTYSLAALLLCAHWNPCHAVSRARCRVACAEEVAACRAEATFRRERRRCKRRWVRVCRIDGLGACEPSSTTTTYSSITTTTSSSSSTTSTTVIPNVRGQWSLQTIQPDTSGDDCGLGLPAFTFTISAQSPLFSSTDGCIAHTDIGGTVKDHIAAPGTTFYETGAPACPPINPTDRAGLSLDTGMYFYGPCQWQQTLTTGGAFSEVDGLWQGNAGYLIGNNCSGGNWCWSNYFAWVQQQSH